MFGINGGELLVLLAVAVVVVGPERLPRYAEQLAHAVKKLRAFLGETKERVVEELGEDAKDLDWEALDPRRYDPRRIVREALLEPEPAPPVTPAGPAYVTGRRPAPPRRGRSAAAAAAIAGGGAAEAALPAPFDDEAT